MTRLLPYALALTACLAMLAAALAFAWRDGAARERADRIADEAEAAQETHDAITDAERRADGCGDGWLDRLRCHREGR